MSLLRTLTITLALGAAGAPAASAAVTIDGRGWGHGIGMSQYGAYGFAMRENRSFDWILKHYYSGTEVQRIDAVRMRVLLKRGSSQKVCGATRVTDARGKRVTLRESRAYRFEPAGSASLRAIDTSTDRRRATLRAPVRVTGGTSTCLRGRAENGLSNGEYRGAMHLERDGSRVNAINRVHVRHYLYGVVPAEMPTSWPLEAVKAQAVAARSYAHRSLVPARAFDVYADVRSQMYRGREAETDRGTQAVKETDGLVLRYGGEIAQTFFFSTSGGRTASNEEVWGTAPVPYLRSVEDPHDDLSPVHTWRETFPQGVASARLSSVTSGNLEGLKVLERGPAGRVLRVQVQGTRGNRTVSGTTIQRLLGLRSIWFSVADG